MTGEEASMVGRAPRALLAALLLTGLAAPAPADPPPAAPVRAVVAGRAVRPDGTAGVGVVVRLAVRPLWGNRLEQVTTSGTDGEYRFSEVPAGDVVAWVADGGLVARGLHAVLADDAGALCRSVRAGGSANIDLELEPGATLRGHVAASDGRVAGVRVEAVPAALERSDDPAVVLPTVVAETDGEGAFALEGLVPGQDYDVRTLPPGAPPVLRPRVAVPVAPGEPPLTIALPAYREVRLHVLDADAPAQGIAGARASLLAGESSRAHDAGRAVTTDAAGRASLLVPTDAAPVLRVEVEGWADAKPAPVPADAEVRVRLHRLRTLEGRVLNPDGSPAAGVEVGLAFAGDDAPHGVTDAKGWFVLEGVAPGQHMVVAGRETAPGRGLRAAAPVSELDTGVTLHLAPFGADGPSLRVRLLDQQGQPVPRARVALTSSGYTAWMRAEAGVAVFDFDAEDPPGAGGMVVVAWRAEGADERPLPLGVAVSEPLEEDAREVELRFPPERVLEGVVRGANGEPIAGALVRAGSTAENHPPLQRALEDARTRTDALGRFALHGLPPVDLRLFVAAPRPWTPPPPTVVRHDAGQVEIRLAEGHAVVVTVLGPDDEPIAGATVSAAPLPGASGPTVGARALTDGGGLARLVGLAPGWRFRLEVDAPHELLAFTEPVWLPAPTTVRLSKAFVIAGRIVTRDGKPLARVFVAFEAEGLPSWKTSMLTGVDGRFRFERVPGGARTLTATIDDALLTPAGAPGPVVARTLRVEAGADDLSVVLDPGRSVEVLLPGGTPDGTPYHLRCRRGPHLLYVTRHSSSRERQWVRGLAADDRLVAYLPADESGKAALGVAEPGASTLHLARTEDGVLRGRLVLPPGASRAHVHASAWDLELGIDAHTDADGNYVLRGVPAGWTWTLSADLRLGEVRYEASFSEVRGSEVPELVLTKVR
jgi:hypothetical protein